jgi:geranylgeranyl diphosphate synthase type I
VDGTADRGKSVYRISPESKTEPRTYRLFGAFQHAPLLKERHREMHNQLKTARDRIGAALSELLNGDGASLLRNAPFWGDDLTQRLGEYALRGKLLRGAFVPFSYWIFTGDETVPSAAIDAGVAMELLQSFLLIHDDIMDQDELRRGLPSIHRQYREIAPQKGDQYGLSMGICAGDVSAFLAIQRLAASDLDPAVKERVLRLVSEEIILVGLAQMQDVHHGYVRDAAQDAVLDVYTYKTGRYTFSLPLAIGAIIAGAEEEQIAVLMKLGESFGRIFQIRDDRLGILEESAATGKATGSDIREDKKTIYRTFLFERLPEDDPLRDVFGKGDVTEEEIAQVRQALSVYRVIDDVDALVAREAERSREYIRDLDVSSSGAEALEALLLFNLDRTV